MVTIKIPGYIDKFRYVWKDTSCPTCHSVLDVEKDLENDIDRAVKVICPVCNHDFVLDRRESTEQKIARFKYRHSTDGTFYLDRDPIIIDKK